MDQVECERLRQLLDQEITQRKTAQAFASIMKNRVTNLAFQERRKKLQKKHLQNCYIKILKVKKLKEDLLVHQAKQRSLQAQEIKRKNMFFERLNQKRRKQQLKEKYLQEKTQTFKEMKEVSKSHQDQIKNIVIQNQMKNYHRAKAISIQSKENKIQLDSFLKQRAHHRRIVYLQNAIEGQTSRYHRSGPNLQQLQQKQKHLLSVIQKRQKRRARCSLKLKAAQNLPWQQVESIISKRQSRRLKQTQF